MAKFWTLVEAETGPKCETCALSALRGAGILASSMEAALVATQLFATMSGRTFTFEQSDTGICDDCGYDGAADETAGPLVFWTAASTPTQPRPSTLCAPCALPALNVVLVVMGEAPAKSMEDGYAYMAAMAAATGEEPFLTSSLEGQCEQCGAEARLEELGA